MKYEITKESKVNIFGVTLFRIKKTETGELGGWIEKESNLSQSGEAWVSGEAEVSGKAMVYGEAGVSGKAMVYGEARVSGKARVYGEAMVSGKAMVYGEARVSGKAMVYGKARVYGEARVSGKARVYGEARVSGKARVYGEAEVSGKARVEKYHQIKNVTNLQFNLTITPQNIAIGCQLKTHEEWLATTKSEAVDMGLKPENYDFFINLIKLLIPTVLE